MITDITFKYLNFIVERKGRSQKIIPQTRSTRADINTKLMVTSSNFNNEYLRPSCQFSTALKLRKSRYHPEKHVRKIDLKIGKRRYNGWKVTEIKMPGQDR